MKVHIVFEKGCINYTSGVESVGYFPGGKNIVLRLDSNYTKEQFRYEGAHEDPIRIYNHCCIPFEHVFPISDIQKLLIES